MNAISFILTWLFIRTIQHFPCDLGNYHCKTKVSSSFRKCGSSVFQHFFLQVTATTCCNFWCVDRVWIQLSNDIYILWAIDNPCIFSSIYKAVAPATVRGLTSVQVILVPYCCLFCVLSNDMLHVSIGTYPYKVFAPTSRSPKQICTCKAPQS